MTVVCSSGVLFGGRASYGADAGLSCPFLLCSASNTSADVGSLLY